MPGVVCAMLYGTHTQPHTIHPCAHVLLCTEDISSGTSEIQLLSSRLTLLCRTSCGCADLDALSPGHGHGVSCGVLWDCHWWLIRPDLFVAWKVHPAQSQASTASDCTCLSTRLLLFSSFLCCSSFSSSALSFSVFTAMSCLHESYSRAFSTNTGLIHIV